MSPEGGVGPRLKAVLFDLDGTLVDSAGDLTGAVNAARTGLGFEAISEAKVRSYIGDGVHVLLSRAIPDLSLVPRALELFRAHYALHMLDTTVPYEGTRAMLDALRARGLALAVVTNKVEGFSRTILERLGLLDAFAVVIGSDSGHGRKPEPGPFLGALAALSVGPREALMVGDARNDILGSRAVQVDCCACGYGIGSAEELRALEPAHWIDRPMDLVAVVERIAGGVR